MRRIALALCAGMCCTALPAQRTWIVDWGGGGDFRDIPPAVAAASPGDTVLVRPGRYRSTSTDKGLRVVGCRIVAPDGLFTVHDVPPDQTFLLAGFGGNRSLTNFAIHLRDNRGRVQIGDIGFTSPGTVPGQARGYVLIERCDDVAVNSCVLYDVTVDDSNVLMTDSVVNGNVDLFVPTPVTGIAIDMTDSRMLLAGTSVMGATTRLTTFLAPGIRMRRGELLVTGTSQNVVGARAALMFQPPMLAPPIDSNDGVVVIDPEIRFVNTHGPSPPPVGNSRFSRRDRSFVLAWPFATPGAQLRPTVHHKPGNLAGLVAGLLSGPLPTPFGELWLDPRVLLPIGSGVLQGSGNEGSLQLTVPVPTTLPSGFVLSFQAAVVDAGALELSLPVRTTIRASCQ